MFNYGIQRLQELTIATMCEILDHNPHCSHWRACKLCATVTHVNKYTIRLWWKHYIEYGELPFITKEVLKERGINWGKRTKKVTSIEIRALKEILDEHPEYYLDEFAKDLYESTGTHLHTSTI